MAVLGGSVKAESGCDLPGYAHRELLAVAFGTPCKFHQSVHLGALRQRRRWVTAATLAVVVVLPGPHPAGVDTPPRRWPVTAAAPHLHQRLWQMSYAGPHTRSPRLSRLAACIAR